MKNNDLQGNEIAKKAAGFPVPAGKKIVEFFLSRSMPVKLLLGLVFLFMLSAMISVGSVYLMLRKHFSVPFKAMGLSEHYKPSLLLDADSIRRTRRAVRGMKAAVDDPWENQFPIGKIDEENEQRLNLLKEKYKELKAYQKLCEIENLNNTFEFHKFWNQETGGTDFSSFTPDQIADLDRKLASILDLSWEDVCVYENSGVEAEASPQILVNVLCDYIFHKKKNDPSFDVSNPISILIRYFVLKSVENPDNNFWTRLTASRFFFGFIHRMCRNDMLTAVEAERVYIDINEVYSRFIKTPSLKATRQYINATKNNLLYAYQLSPFGTWLLMNAFGDPVEAAAAHVELLKMPPTIQNEPHFKKQSVNFIYYLEQQNHRMSALDEARLIFRMACQEAIVKQMLLDVMRSDEKIMDPYSSKPLLVIEKEGKKIYYSSGSDLNDNKATGDDICWELE